MAGLAQLVEHLICNQRVGSSSLSTGTTASNKRSISTCPPDALTSPTGSLINATDGAAVMAAKREAGVKPALYPQL